MEDIKLRLANEIAAKLSGAPDSAAKSELVEELSENLYSRYLEMTESGVEPESAFQFAMGDLGDTDELVDYLNSLDPGEPLPGPEPGPQPQGGSTWADLNEIFKNVGEIVRDSVNAAMSAVDIDGIVKDAVAQAKDAAKEAKSAVNDVKKRMKRDGYYTYTSPNGHVEVRINTDPKDVEDAELEAKLAQEEATLRQNLAAEGITGEEADQIVADTLESTLASMEKDMADSSPQKKDVIYGFGYDEAKGGWFTQWGEWNGPKSQAGDEPKGPLFRSEGNGWMEARDGGDYAFHGEIRRIDIDVGGDVAIRAGDEGEDDVVIGGDVSDLEVTRSEDGLLVIRQENRTASSGFFFRRGMYSADVELTLPRRRWELIKVGTVSGDVEIEGDDPVDTMIVKTVSGDVNGCMGRCEKLDASTASGDINWHGDADKARFESASGDVRLEGYYGSLHASSMSGDVDLEGQCRVDSARCSSVSGDVRLESETLPTFMELSSKSGDIDVRLPDVGPFSVNYRTTSGNFTSDFFTGHMASRRSFFSYRGGESAGGPVYRMSTISGDLSLCKL